jgi:oligoribonuclease
MLGVFLDSETSGLDPYIHTVLELAFVIVDLQSGRELLSWEAVLKPSLEDWERSDQKSLLIHGMSWEQLSSGIDLQEARLSIEEVCARFGIVQNRAVFICQNPSFDRPFFSKIIPPYRQEELHLPYHWLDLASMYWALILSKRQATTLTISFSKDAIAKDCGLPPELHPHRAMNGVRHLLLCYEKLIGFGSNSQASGCSNVT